jgi:hypothetical protein
MLTSQKKATRRSTTGVIAVFADGAMSSTSRLQKTTALSTSEAEIIQSEGAKLISLVEAPIVRSVVSLRQKDTDTVHQ